MKNRQLGFFILTAMVVGNMVGSGTFMLPRTLAEVASPAGVLWAWGITGFGVFMLALVYGNLAIRKPGITGGPQIYAKELFSQHPKRARLSGFIVTWGYWVADFVGVVAILITFASYLSTFFPILTSQAILMEIGTFQLRVGNALTFLVCSGLLWLIVGTILLGMDTAGRVNFIATFTKILGFLFFIGVTLFTFDINNVVPLVQPRFDEVGVPVSLFGQVNHAAISTLWAFAGIESALVLSDRVKRASDVKWATVTGLLIATLIYIGITLLVMGNMGQEELIQSEKPLADALIHAIGPSGGYIISLLGCVAILGTSIGWIMIAAEVPHQAAKNGMFLRFFLPTNKAQVPHRSLLLSCGLTQIFLFSTISQSMARVFDLFVFVSILTYLLPLGIASFYQLKLVFTGETYEKERGRRWVDGIISTLASLYSVWLVITGTADPIGFLLGILLLVSGLLFYPLLPQKKIS